VSTLTWSAGTDALVAGSLGGDAVLLSADDGCPTRLPGGDGGVLAAAWSPDGGAVAVGAQGGCLTVWLAQDAAGSWSIDLGDWVGALAWAPDGQALAAAAGPDVRVLGRDATLVVAYPFLPGHVNDVAWQRSGRLAVALRGAVRFYEPPEPEPVAEAPTASTVLSLAVSADDAMVAGGKLNGSILLLTPSRGKGLSLSGYDGGVRALAWRADAARLAVGAHGETSVWRVADGVPVGEPVEVLRSEPAPGGLAFHPYLDLLATGGADGTVALWLPGVTDTTVGSISLGEEVSALAWQPTGDALAVGTADGRAVLLELGSG